MNAIIKRLRIRRTYFFAMLAMLMIGLVMTACNREPLDIKRDFPFEVSVMPVPKEITKGETVEIRCKILRKGNYEGTKYNIRYFQFDGQGVLRCGDAPPYLPNDLYPLPGEVFRLYYTSGSVVSQSFDIWVGDNFGNEKQVNFQFSGKNTEG
ncbi:DUF3872 domain-containing protein [Chryseobacterium gallinarum]|uniref:DUF3872 domain-containing protein n=1 Tax=Chryseobacterium gallinarum TaxID=1324352 RepID=UPI0020254D39|nr:DUF3872 domain-containing protein [Chryseobacterium gallinarum]MCL8537659.1 DUF3872 domain-containing protein [Chryseobacterium gallinarum]